SVQSLDPFDRHSDFGAGLKPFVASDSSLSGDLSDSPYAKTF
ncbi:hypothetical protein Tco_0474974, partial [Tanacetum coccineum]